jgi:hypothetical protein
MEIGKPERTFTVEPAEDPFRREEPKRETMPQPERKELPAPVRTPKKVPA